MSAAKPAASGARSSKTTRTAAPKKAAPKKPAAKKTASKQSAAKSAKKTTTKKTAAKKPAAKTAAKKTTAKKAAARKAPVKKTAAKKVAKATSKKAAPKKTAPKKTVSKKTVSKKATSKKTSKKATATKAAAAKKSTSTKKPTAKAAKKPAVSETTESSTAGSMRFSAGGFSFDFGPKIDTDLARQPEEHEDEVVPATRKRGRNAAGFSAAELRTFRSLLILKRAELLGDVTSMESEALRAEGTNLANLTEHMADRGTDNYEQEFTLDLVQKDRELLSEINHALAKLDGKEQPPFGICEGTGQPIRKARLEVQPWARFSVDHARKRERNGRI